MENVTKHGSDPLELDNNFLTEVSFCILEWAYNGFPERDEVT